MMCPIHKANEEIHGKTINKFIERMIPEQKDAYIRCDLHPSKIATIYCKSDSIIMCAECAVLSNHQNH